MSKIQDRLATLGITLDAPAPPVAAYAPVVLHGELAYVSGQLPRRAGELVKGRVGQDLTAEEASEAARLCAIAVLGVLRQALDGDLDRVVSCLQLNGFVAAVDTFEAHSAVINGASQLMVDVLGANGAHARAAIGVASLPFGVPVEVSAIFVVEAV